MEKWFVFVEALFCILFFGFKSHWHLLSFLCSDIICMIVLIFLKLASSFFFFFFFLVSALYIIKLLLLYRINDVMTKLRYLSVIPLAGLKMLTLF